MVWAAAVTTGFFCLLQYEKTPGQVGALSSCWPAGSSLVFDPTRLNLVMLAHPRCPCTRASVAELAQIMARSGERTAACVLFLRPKGFPASWARTDLWRGAEAIPGVNVLCDEEGVEARRFGAVTSGHVVLFDRDGRLLFRGGITSTRGHLGDNAGRRGVLALLTRGAVDRTETPVFGCPLHDPDAPCTSGVEPCNP